MVQRTARKGPNAGREFWGHADMPRLVAALRARDQRLGLGVSGEENVA